jgi:hypothetical protein
MGMISRGDPVASYKAARRHVRINRLAQLKVENQVREEFRSFREKQQSLTMASLQDTVGVEHQFASHDLLAAPASLEHFDFLAVFPDARGMAKKLVAIALGSPRKFADFLIFLEFDWANKHQTIMHVACAVAMGSC